MLIREIHLINQPVRHNQEKYISSLAIDQVALLITKRTLYEELIKQNKSVLSQSPTSSSLSCPLGPAAIKAPFRLL